MRRGARLSRMPVRSREVIDVELSRAELNALRLPVAICQPFPARLYSENYAL
jgi:hypothetical protein